MATNTPVNIANLIYTRPNFRGGRPCLADTGTTVHTVVAAHLEGLSPEQILEELPYLDLSRIYAALAYYYANKAQVEADFEASRRLGEELALRNSRNPDPRGR